MHAPARISSGVSALKKTVSVSTGAELVAVVDCVIVVVVAVTLIDTLSQVMRRRLL